MIAKMSRVSLIVSKQESSTALTELANTNVFHIGTLENYNESIADLHRRLGHAELMLRYLPETTPSTVSDKKIDINTLQQSIEKAYTTRSDLEKLMREYTNYIDNFVDWGEFSLEDINFLAKEGHFIRLYRVESRYYKKLQKETSIPLYTCNVSKGFHYIVAYSVDETKFPSMQSVELPPKSLEQMRKAVLDSRKQIISLTNELIKLNEDRHHLEQFIVDLTQTIQFEQVSDSINHDEELSILSGFVPTDDIEYLKQYAKKHGWALLMQDALSQDEEQNNKIPTKINPSFFGKFIQPMLDSFGFVSGYQEVDISGVMFFFFTIFFAMIIGDAGYGLIFLFMSLNLLFKSKKLGKASNPFVLYITFISTATVAWGIITDNWFGYHLSNNIHFLKPLKIEFLTTTKGIQFFTFMLGFTHLTVAHTWSFFRRIKHNPKSALADIGQLMMLTSLLFLIVDMIVGSDTILGAPPKGMIHIIIVGIILVLFFGEQQPAVSIFKGVSNGLKFEKVLSMLLGSIGNFADILSYIRLYAVGLAGFSIANSFNQLASLLPLPATIIVLLLAHSLNIMLSILSVIVHGLRLNSLEFSTHVGLNWSGLAYRPFNAKKIIK